MSGYTNFAVIGAGNFGNFIIQQLLKDKAAGTVKEIVVLTREVKYLTNNSAVHDMLSTTHWLWTLRDPNPPFRVTPR
jgi:pyrroline-5-carboxylate reductase